MKDSNKSTTTRRSLSFRDYYIDYGNISYEIDAEHTDKELTRNEMELIHPYLSGVKTSVHLCCGAGRHVEAFTNLGISSLGIDISPLLLGIGRENLKYNNLSTNSLLVVGLANATPIRSHSADCVTILGNSFSLFGENEGRLLLREAERILRFSGIVILDIPCARYVATSLSCGQKISRKIKTRAFGEINIEWNRQIDMKTHTVLSLETYTFLDEHRCEQVKNICFSFRLYEPEEICVMGASTGLRLLAFLEYNDSSGRYLGMLKRRIFLVMRTDR